MTSEGGEVPPVPLQCPQKKKRGLRGEKGFKLGEKTPFSELSAFELQRIPLHLRFEGSPLKENTFVMILSVSLGRQSPFPMIFRFQWKGKTFLVPFGGFELRESWRVRAKPSGRSWVHTSQPDKL